MEPALCPSHNEIGVIDEEAIFIGVAEVVEANDGFTASVIKRTNELAVGIYPDELAVSLSRLLGDPCCIRFTVFARAADITWAIDHPSDLTCLTVSFSEVIYTEGGSSNEVGPPTIVLFRFDS